MFHNSFLAPRCMYCASEAVHLHANGFPHWCVGSMVIWRIGSSSLRLELPMDCAVKAVNSNNGFFLCSTMDSTTPKTDISRNDAHVTAAKSCCAPTRARLMAYPPKHTHGASCVEPNDSLCTEMQWLTRVSSSLPCLAGALPCWNSMQGSNDESYLSRDEKKVEGHKTMRSSSHLCLKNWRNT